MKKIVKKFANHHLFRFDVKYFLHFFVVFTIIFVALSAIILQTLTSGIYNSTDETIERLAKNPLMLTNLALHGTNKATVFSDGLIIIQITRQIQYLVRKSLFFLRTKLSSFMIKRSDFKC